MQIEVNIPAAPVFDALRIHAQKLVQERVASFSPEVRRVTVRIEQFQGYGVGSVLTSAHAAAALDLPARTISTDGVASNPYKAVEDSIARLAVLLASADRDARARSTPPHHVGAFSQPRGSGGERPWAAFNRVPDGAVRRFGASDGRVSALF